jgi:hypothetical protein
MLAVIAESSDLMALQRAKGLTDRMVKHLKRCKYEVVQNLDSKTYGGLLDRSVFKMIGTRVISRTSCM